MTVQEAAAGRIRVHVVGFSMGNAWIAPDEQSMSYGPMLYQLVSRTSVYNYRHTAFADNFAPRMVAKHCDERVCVVCL